MALPIRPRVIPHCSSCLRSYAWAGLTEPTTTALGQQVRGAKKMAKNSNTVPVRLLKDVQTFGRRGAIVPISPGQMRNEWFPRNVAAYIAVPELRTLRLRNVAMERDVDFGLTGGLAGRTQVDQSMDMRAADGMTMGEQQEASMFQKTPVEQSRLSAERSAELVEIFVPQRLEFYRQPILEEKEPEPAPPPEQPRRQLRGLGVGAELMAARMQQPDVPKSRKPTGPQAIYGSVSTHDILVAVRAALATNDEAARVVLHEEDVTFVDLMAEAGLETDRVKSVGDYAVEIKPKGVEMGLNRTVRVVAQEAAGVQQQQQQRQQRQARP